MAKASDEKSRRLEDTHLVMLSQRLTDVGDIEKLAYRGLSLQHHEVQPAFENNPSENSGSSLRDPVHLV